MKFALMMTMINECDLTYSQRSSADDNVQTFCTKKWRIYLFNIKLFKKGITQLKRFRSDHIII
jgi:hypothetical protein